MDHLNRTTAEQWMQGSTVVNTIATGYNADGEVTSAGDSFSNYAFGYDGQGHLASVNNSGTPGVPDVVLAGQFDGQGDRTSLSATIAGVKDFLNSFSYDTLSRLTGIEQQGQTGGNAVNPKTVNFVLDGIGDITQIYRMNSVGMGPNPQSDPADSAISYNSLGQLAGITPSHNGVNIDPLSWTFDTLGREATFTNSDGTATYGYDKTSQLTSASYTGATEPPNESYSFDPNGNQNGSGHVVSPANQVTNDGTFTFAFDNEGNRTSRTRDSNAYATDHTVTYSWDYRDRLTDVNIYDNNSVLTKHVHYVYGVFDHLIETEVDPTGGGTYTVITHNIYDLRKPVVTAEYATQPVEPGLTISAAGNVVLQTTGLQQLTERILNGPITSAYDAFFTDLAQEDVASGMTYWMLLNSQGSLSDEVDANGNQVNHDVYKSFGALFSESNSSVPHAAGYSGGLFDPSTGLVNDWERWYDPTTAVWLSVDPSGFYAGDSNLTRYVGNTPTNLRDPYGLAEMIAEDGFFGSVGNSLWSIGKGAQGTCQYLGNAFNHHVLGRPGDQTYIKTFQDAYDFGPLGQTQNSSGVYYYGTRGALAVSTVCAASAAAIGGGEFVFLSNKPILVEGCLVGGRMGSGGIFQIRPTGNQNETGHVVSPANQVTNDGTFTYAFDNEGNRVSRTRISSDFATDHTVTYSWDYRDRLTDVEYFDNNSVLTKHVHYVYGVFDHLIETEVDPTGGGTYTIITHNIYDLSKPVVTAEDATQPVEPGLMISAAGNVVLQTNDSQQLTGRILNGPIISAYDAFFTALAQDDMASGKSYWFLLNNQGSFMDAVDANGDQMDHAVYTGFGELYDETNPSIPHLTGFVGGLSDAITGDVNFVHRWYDPVATVWLSIDPKSFRAGDSNLTRYVGEDPQDATDEEGEAEHRKNKRNSTKDKHQRQHAKNKKTKQRQKTGWVDRNSGTVVKCVAIGTGVGIIVGTVVEDFFTFGGGTLDDPVCFAAGSALIMAPFVGGGASDDMVAY